VDQGPNPLRSARIPRAPAHAAIPGRNMRYAKGPAPAVGDMVDSELAFSGP
jgi:hypothetical protein